jgi:hypothetical protein
VARARRLATSALSHLASHSDCWQQRTLSGVQPRKVLARFSEDDYAIYENRLYKRLLDRLDRHLARRLARIRGVNSRLERALEFQGSEQTHFRLRQDICRLWGESYLDDKTGMQLEAGKLALAELESQLRAIRGLKQRGLYSLVPAASVVPAQIHRTNILNHDPHYRHLPPLWEKLKDDREERLLPPEERLARQLQLQHAYVSYVGLVVRRALERYGLRSVDGNFVFSWADRNFVLKHDAHDWVVTQSDGSTLRIVPIAWFGASINSSESLEPGRIVCWPGAPTSVASPQCLPVSPLDLYVVEKVGKLIDEWMLRQLLNGHGRKLGPLPTPTKKLTEAWPEQFESISPTHVRLLAPIDAQKAAELRACSEVRRTHKLRMPSALPSNRSQRLLSFVAIQRDSNPGQQQDFYCQCATCQTTWSLKTTGKRRHFSMRPKGASTISEANGFCMVWQGLAGVRLGFSRVMMDKSSESTHSESERLEILRWLLFDNHKFTSCFASYRYLKSFVPTAPDPGVMKWLKSRIDSAFGIVNAHLHDRQFLVGTKPTIADISLCGYLFYPEEESGCGFVERYRHIASWLDRLRQIPGWAQPHEIFQNPIVDIVSGGKA